MTTKHLLITSAVAAVLLVASHARAEEIAFTFSGYVEDPSNPYSNTPFAFSFDVDTLDPGNTLSDTFAGGLLQTISVGVVATNLNATLGGVVLAQGAPGSMSFMGHDCIGTCNGAFWGPGLGISGGATAPDGAPAFDLVDVPQFGVGSASEAAITGSSDPLGLLLAGSWYGSDDPALLFLNGELVSTDVTFTGVDPPLPDASVPEPGTLGLLLLGVSPLFFLRRKCRRCQVPLYVAERWQGTCRPCRARVLRRVLREIEQRAQHRRATPTGQ